MLGGEHALLQASRRVAGLDRHLGLAQHLAGVELFGDDMDRAAADGIPGLDRSSMRVEPAIFGQQGRVDVDDPRRPLLDEPGREDAHEPGERDGADAMCIESSAQFAVECLLVDALAVPRPSSQPTCLCPFEAAAPGLFGSDERDLIAGRLLDERTHVAAATGNQDCQHVLDHALWVADQSPDEFQIRRCR